MIKSSAPDTHGETGEGDLMPGDPGAQPNGGGQGNLVDPSQSFPWGNGIPDAVTMYNDYHVHAFLGLYVNGQEIAIPDGVGMINPYPDNDSSAPCTSGFNNFTCYADDFYYIHTHDASGAIHLEAPSQTLCGTQSTPSGNVWDGACNWSVFTLGNVLDVWGISISANNFGPFQGPVQIWTSPQKFISCPPTCEMPSNIYSLYTGDPTQMALYSHMVVWVLVGSGNPTGASLPNVEWYTAY